MNKYTTETNKQVLLDSLQYGNQGTLNRDGIMMRLLELNLKPLIESIDKTSKAIETATDASDHLGRKVFWLNIILGSATVGGFIIAVLGFTKNI